MEPLAAPPVLPPPVGSESILPPTWTRLEPEPDEPLNTNLHDYDPLETK